MFFVLTVTISLGDIKILQFQSSECTYKNNWRGLCCLGCITVITLLVLWKNWNNLPSRPPCRLVIQVLIGHNSSYRNFRASGFSSNEFVTVTRTPFLLCVTIKLDPHLDSKPKFFFKYSKYYFCLSFQAQSTEVQIPPNLVCPDCTIRLSRQAADWGNTYRFLSCADVDIVDENVSKHLREHS